MRESTEYRIRRGTFGKCVLQRLEKDEDNIEWVDVPYNSAPRALQEKFELSEKYQKIITDLEIDNQRLSSENEGLERLIEHLQKLVDKQ